MGRKMGNAGRARKLAKLFEKWRRAFERQDAEAMVAARQAIDTIARRTVGEAEPKE
jgi:hypothetical protein